MCFLLISSLAYLDCFCILVCIGVLICLLIPITLSVTLFSLYSHPHHFLGKQAVQQLPLWPQKIALKRRGTTSMARDRKDSFLFEGKIENATQENDEVREPIWPLNLLWLLVQVPYQVTHSIRGDAIQRMQKPHPFLYLSVKCGSHLEDPLFVETASQKENLWEGLPLQVKCILALFKGWVMYPIGTLNLLPWFMKVIRKTIREEIIIHATPWMSASPWFSLIPQPPVNRYDQPRQPKNRHMGYKIQRKPVWKGNIHLRGIVMTERKKNFYQMKKLWNQCHLFFCLFFQSRRLQVSSEPNIIGVIGCSHWGQYPWTRYQSQKQVKRKQSFPRHSTSKWVLNSLWAATQTRMGQTYLQQAISQFC